ncbi:hypothetical protein SAMN04487972_13715 [Paracoccus halophilus]|uniref:Uncharacterized protein n=1 Tax=Paracoccus halophilus TaxID=376733 RepID=A0A1I0UBX9_9RHOB|nr:hypothetical protein [Paracoccus halophilus]SFA61534.1 hypothetical protein SAMN04487972_13715 [Paracoccus halophilus]
MYQVDAGGILDIAMAGTSATLLARKWESALLVNVDNETLRKIMDNPEAMNRPGFTGGVFAQMLRGILCLFQGCIECLLGFVWCYVSDVSVHWINLVGWIVPNHNELIQNAKTPKALQVSKAEPKNRVLIPFDLHQAKLRFLADVVYIHIVVHLVPTIGAKDVDLSPCEARKFHQSRLNMGAPVPLRPLTRHPPGPRAF